MLLSQYPGHREVGHREEVESSVNSKLWAGKRIVVCAARPKIPSHIRRVQGTLKGLRPYADNSEDLHSELRAVDALARRDRAYTTPAIHPDHLERDTNPSPSACVSRVFRQSTACINDGLKAIDLWLHSLEAAQHAFGRTTAHVSTSRGAYTIPPGSQPCTSRRLHASFCEDKKELAC